MNSKLRHLLLIVFSIFPILTWGTESLSTADSIRISLLTCAPGEEIYSLFGHTAIRYEEPARGIDRVYNYGLFSFNTPNFILRFALGKTDYQLGWKITAVLPPNTNTSDAVYGSRRSI